MGGASQRGPIGVSEFTLEIDEGTLKRTRMAPSKCEIEDYSRFPTHCTMLIEEPGYREHYKKVRNILVEVVEKYITSDAISHKLYKGKLSEEEKKRYLMDAAKTAFHDLMVRRRNDTSQVLRDAEHYLFTLTEYGDSPNWLALKSRVYNALKSTEKGRLIAGKVFGGGKIATKVGRFEHHFNVGGANDLLDVWSHMEQKAKEAGKKWEIKQKEREEKLRKRERENNDGNRPGLKQPLLNPKLNNENKIKNTRDLLG